MAYQLPQEIKNILSPLAEAVLPLAAWIARKKYSPDPTKLVPSEGALPWRPEAEDPRLSTALLEAVQFFEAQFDGDAENQALAPRWLMLKSHPLAFFQPKQGSAEAWRQGRRLPSPENGPLDPAPAFAPHEGTSANFAYVLIAPDQTLDPVPRTAFYEACWIRLKAAYASVLPVDTPSWSNFASKLLNDQLAAWPANPPVKSSGFIKRFSTDILLATLNQHNGALSGKPLLWQRAVLIEAGENRHVGNEYTVGQVSAAVATLVNTIAALPNA